MTSGTNLVKTGHGKSSGPADQRNALRHRLQAARKQLSEATISAHSTAIAHNLQTLLSSAQHVAGYLALGQEVSLAGAMQQLRERKVCTYVPLIKPGNTMVFAPIDDTTRLVTNRFGIQEPDVPPAQCKGAYDLDLVLVPLVGFDSQGNRMGMGGGFYDRTFAHRRTSSDPSPDPALNSSSSSSSNTATGERSGTVTATGLDPKPGKPLLIGVAYEMQAVDSVFPDWWDVPLDHVVTESGVLSPKRSPAPD